MPTATVRPSPPREVALLATERLHTDEPLVAVPPADRARRGAVAVRPRRGVVRRAEPGPHGPLIYEATQGHGHVDVGVWGPPATPVADREAAVAAARGWLGWYDDPPDMGELTADHPRLHHAARFVGSVRVARLPRVQESFGRAVLGQLVQTVEARRSIAQLAARAGQPAGGGLWTWPTADALTRTPAYAMRRCGISLKGAVAIQRAALDDARLERDRDDTDLFDRRLRAMPGVGVWTSAETRYALGDPDAVSVGDLHLPSIVCHALAGATGDACTDELMLELLEPYRGQRGRVTQLVSRAVGRGLLPREGRRAPRAALSLHRYW